MRRIKFRGKDLSTSKWLVGALVPNGTKSAYIAPFGELFHLEEVDSDTVGEYTGIYDKNDIEIYEGDIISIEFTEPVYLDEPTKYHQVFVVEYKKGCFCLVGDRTLLFTDCRLEQQKLEVIGNMYDNPDMLSTL